jgi:hypothetical protein
MLPGATFSNVAAKLAKKDVTAKKSITISAFPLKKT